MTLSEKASDYLHKLCSEIPSRRVGSKGNREATDFFARLVDFFGFETECPEFDCIDWTHGDVHLTAQGKEYQAFASPYALGCQVHAPLVVASTLEELEATDALGKILLVQGELAKEQLMPKEFPFYNPEHHKKIAHLLETKAPQAIVAATSRDPALAGGVYPFPLIEDGDFDIPSTYMTAEEGERLATDAGQEVSLEMVAERIPAKGCNVIARKGISMARRVVVCAHIDAKMGTPGALDNATGVAVLLLLAELLTDYAGDLGIEIVAVNGEDYYAASGEIQFVESNAGRFSEIVLGINLDGAGYKGGNTAYSLYECPAEMSNLIRSAFTARQGFVEGEPWYQSDHMLFVQNQRPALALTSDRFTELWTHIAHTPKDRPEIVDPAKLVAIGLTLRDLLLDLAQN